MRLPCFLFIAYLLKNTNSKFVIEYLFHEASTASSMQKVKYLQYLSTAFQPSSLFANSGFAHTFSISPARRPTI